MHARLLTFSQLHDVDRAVVFLHETALSVLKKQFGFRGVSARYRPQGGRHDGAVALGERVRAREQLPAPP